MATTARKRSYDDSLEPQQDDESMHVDGDGIQTHGQPSLTSPNAPTDTGGDWQLVEGRSKKKNKRNKGKLKNRNKSESRHGAADSRSHVPAPTHKQAKPTDNRPAVICAATHTLNSSLRIADLQALVLYCLADGVAPQWIGVRHRTQIRKAVVLMVPGLEKGMFTGNISLEADLQVGPESDSVSTLNQKPFAPKSRSPDDYLPIKLETLSLSGCLQPFADIFPHLFPVKAPGEDRRVHSPVAAILTCPLTKSSEEKNADRSIKGAKPARVAKDFVDVPTPITAYVTSTKDLIENEYLLHPASCHDDETDKAANERRRHALKATAENGWKDANVTALPTKSDGATSSKALDAGRSVYAVDCEMCKVQGDEPETSQYALTRISVVNWKGDVVLDELVKPDRPIIDYVTAFSGMTAAKLAPITTTLSEIQTKLLDLFTADSILIGHSLNSDLNAMKMTHPFVVDTSIIYPHPRGSPFKSSLKWLAQKYLNREIQKHDGSLGHDSVEDARATLDLAKVKCKRGPRWGTSEAAGEDMFRRLSRTPRAGSSGSNPVNASLRDCRTGALVDHGRPERTLGKNALVSIGCATDDEVVAGIKRTVNGDPDGSVVPGGGVDFVFARMRELEAFRGWSTDASPNLHGPGNTAKSDNGDDDGKDGGSSNVASPDQTLSAQVGRLAARIADVRASLPKCTLFIVYSGVGDPREMKRLGDMQRQFRREYAVKNWDDISVKWTDDEEQALKRAVREARDGLAFVTVT